MVTRDTRESLVDVRASWPARAACVGVDAADCSRSRFRLLGTWASTREILDVADTPRVAERRCRARHEDLVRQYGGGCRGQCAAAHAEAGTRKKRPSCSAARQVSRDASAVHRPLRVSGHVVAVVTANRSASRNVLLLEPSRFGIIDPPGSNRVPVFPFSCAVCVEETPMRTRSGRHERRLCGTRILTSGGAVPLVAIGPSGRSGAIRNPAYQGMAIHPCPLCSVRVAPA